LTFVSVLSALIPPRWFSYIEITENGERRRRGRRKDEEKEMIEEERDKSVVCPYCVDPQYRHI
jgi:hypothetical protein